MRKAKKVDVVVLGVGGMGSAACCQLAERGLNVLGIEQFAIPHRRGSSHGQTRIIRTAYFEHPGYVPLLHRAFEGWANLEKKSGEPILYPCGMILYAGAGSEVYQGTLRSLKEHQLPLEQMSAEEAARRWEVYRPAEHHSVLFEPKAGFVCPEKAVSAYVEEAKKAGAEILQHCRVHHFSSGKDGVTLRTGHGEIIGKKLVITAGAWSARILADLGVPFRLLRKHLSWHAAGQQHHVENGLPCALFGLEEHLFYLFPALDAGGVKIGKHSGGEPIAEPEQKERDRPGASFLKPLEGFIERCLPQVEKTYRDFETCIYTMTPDHHFMIDRHPEDENIVFAAGFSGHGFKFVPVAGEILADLTVTGNSDLLPDFLRYRTFGNG